MKTFFTLFFLNLFLITFAQDDLLNSLKNQKQKFLRLLKAINLLILKPQN